MNFAFYVWHIHALMTDSPVPQVLLQLRHCISRLPKFQTYAWKQHPLMKDIPVALLFRDSFISLQGYSVIYTG